VEEEAEDVGVVREKRMSSVLAEVRVKVGDVT